MNSTKNNKENNYYMYNLDKLNTAAKASYIKHDSPEVKDVVNFADRFWYVLELLKTKKLKIAMQKSDNHYDADVAMIRIQALEWVQGRMQDIILDNVTWQVRITTKLYLYRVSNAFIFLPVSAATFFESITKALSK